MSGYRDKQVETYRLKGWVTSKEVARVMQLNPTTISRLASNDLVRSKRVGFALYINLKDLKKHYGDDALDELKPKK